MGSTGCGLDPGRVRKNPEVPAVSDERNDFGSGLGKGSEAAMMVTLAGKLSEEMDGGRKSTRELNSEYLERSMIRGRAKVRHGVC